MPGDSCSYPPGTCILSCVPAKSQMGVQVTWRCFVASWQLLNLKDIPASYEQKSLTCTLSTQMKMNPTGHSCWTGSFARQATLASPVAPLTSHPWLIKMPCTKNQCHHTPPLYPQNRAHHSTHSKKQLDKMRRCNVNQNNTSFVQSRAIRVAVPGSPCPGP